METKSFSKNKVDVTLDLKQQKEATKTTKIKKQEKNLKRNQSIDFLSKRIQFKEDAGKPIAKLKKVFRMENKEKPLNSKRHYREREPQIKVHVEQVSQHSSCSSSDSINPGNMLGNDIQRM